MVDHHGSHNATLLGGVASDYANLDWMAESEYEHEFTARITAVREWADTQKGWDHALKSIKDELLTKSEGRLLQTDTDAEKMKALFTGQEQVHGQFCRSLPR